MVGALVLCMVSLLDALLLMVNTRQGEMVAALSLRGATDHVFPPRGARSPPMRLERIPPFRGERITPLRRESVDRCCLMGLDLANPTFEQMARHWFDSFCANPSVESFAHCHSHFDFAGGKHGEHVVD